jgi:hypothetical protein
LPRLLPLLRRLPVVATTVVVADLAVAIAAAESQKAGSAQCVAQATGPLGSPQQESRHPSHSIGETADELEEPWIADY